MTAKYSLQAAGGQGGQASKDMKAHLHDGLLAFNLEHLAATLAAVLQGQIHDLGVAGELRESINEAKSDGRGRQKAIKGGRPSLCPG